MHQAPILIVDDEPSNLAILRQILSPEYSLVFACNGAEALAATNKHHPALILLDVQMPDMDGYTVCRQLKNDPQTEAIPVIFISSLAEVGDEVSGFSVGAVDYITKPVSPLIVRSRVRSHLSLVNIKRLEQSYCEAIYMLSEAGHYNDTDTGAHIWRIAAYSSTLASACGWDADACRKMELAAPMHDTGKLGIPSTILQKPGKLDAEERAVIQTHSRIGYNILTKSSAPIFQMAAEIALHHHEKWDGSGYPDGLAGESIPESARIVAIVDVFDALSMKRPYKEAWPLDRVMLFLNNEAGTHFDPRLIKIFISIQSQIATIKASWDKDENT